MQSGNETGHTSCKGGSFLSPLSHPAWKKVVATSWSEALDVKSKGNEGETYCPNLVEWNPEYIHPLSLLSLASHSSLVAGLLHMRDAPQ